MVFQFLIHFLSPEMWFLLLLSFLSSQFGDLSSRSYPHEGLFRTRRAVPGGLLYLGVMLSCSLVSASSSASSLPPHLHPLFF